jgi:hypothetical protein
MRRSEGLRGFRGYAIELIEAQGPLAELRGQGMPVNELHDEVGSPIVLADIVQSADVRMIERGGGLRLTLEADSEILALSFGGVDDFDSDRPAKPDVASSIDLPHGAFAEQAFELIGTEARTCVKGPSNGVFGSQDRFDLPLHGCIPLAGVRKKVTARRSR